jgi:hypothetical protein
MDGIGLYGRIRYDWIGLEEMGWDGMGLEWIILDWIGWEDKIRLDWI